MHIVASTSCRAVARVKTKQKLNNDRLKNKKTVKTFRITRSDISRRDRLLNLTLSEHVLQQELCNLNSIESCSLLDLIAAHKQI